MTADNKTLWLSRVLLVKASLTIFLWGLPALLAPLSLLELLGLPVPTAPLFLRLFGSVCVAWGVAYWLAHQDPVRNVAIVKAGVVDNALATVTIVVLGLTSGISSAFVWLSAVLTTIFFLLFLILMPREGQSETV